jgi:hypothetical protein
MVQMTGPLAVGRWPLAARALLLLALVACGVRPSPAGAQSAYVPLDDVAYVYIDALIARGELRNLSVLGRPYTVAAIRQALSPAARPPAVARGRLPLHRRTPPQPADRSVSALRDALLAAVAKYDFSTRRRAEFRAEGSASLWATGETSGRRELMLADDVEPRAYAGGAARLLMAGGPVVAFMRPILENRLNSDPEFHGRKDRRIAGRVEDAYVSAQWRYAELFFGRAARTWGPYTHQGLLLSDAPYTYDHLFGRFGVQRFNGEIVLARLEDHWSPDGFQQRYFAAHRVNGRWRGVEASIGESVVYSGVARGFEFSTANPLNLYALAWRNEDANANLLVNAKLAARTRFGVLSGELMIDDLQIDRCDEICQEPSSYGFTFSAEGLRLTRAQRAFASYTRVSALTYRTPESAERYSMFDVGLGRGYSDYDEVRAGLDLIPRATPVRVYFAHRRQGAGDYRRLFPAPEDYAAQPGIFEPPVRRVNRVGVSGGRVFGQFDVRGDIGLNWVRAEGSPLETHDSEFEGRVRVSWNPRWARVRLAP